jgi:hypothetical protein
MIKRLKKLANVFKPNKFHYALLDYLADELKSNNISCRKQTSYIKIKLASPVEDKFNHIIIDCFNGSVYLRGDEAKDKKVLKLNRFYGDRESDAMHCARGSAKQIMRYLESLDTSKQLEVEANNKPTYIDMRKNVVSNIIKDMRKVAFNNCEKITKLVTDLRKFAKNSNKEKKNLIDLRMKKISRLKKIADILGRDFAISIINGKVYTADVHGQTMSNFLKDMGITDIEFYDRYELEDSLGKGFIIDFAAAHAVGNKIYIEPDTLMNLDLNEAIDILSQEFKGYEIYNANTNEKIAEKVSRLKKLARDRSDRDYENGAIVYIDGEIITGGTHAEAISKYLHEKVNVELEDSYYRPYVFDPSMIQDPELYSDEEHADIQKIKDNIKQIAFAHINTDEGNIYIEEDTLQNVDLNTVASAIKNKFPDFNICSDETDEKVAKKTIDLRNMSRLRKIATDIEDRDFEGAIVYIDGEIYTGRTHATAINNYIQEKFDYELSNTWCRPNLKNNDNSFLSDERIKDKEIIRDNIKQLGFAHKISKLPDVEGDENIILVEQDSLYNVDLNTVANAIKNKYPDFDIYIDETDEKVARK